MKKILLISMICSVCLSSCMTTFRLVPTLSLEEAKLNNISGVGDINQTERRFENEIIVFIFDNTVRAFQLSIENKTTDPLSLILDEAFAVDVDGFSYRLQSELSRGAGSNLLQAPVQISPKSTIKLNLILSRQVQGRIAGNVFPFTSHYYEPDRLAEQFSQYVNYKFFIPIKNTISNETNNYEFVLKIVKFKAF